MSFFTIFYAVFTACLLCLTAAVEDKVVYVSGASSGIGLQVSKDLAAEGYKVFMVARREAPLKEAVSAIKAAGGKAAYSICDVTSEDSVEASFAAAELAFGGVDFVFSNAGIEGDSFSAGGLELSNEKNFKKIFDINVIGAGFVTLKHAVKAFEKRGGGQIAFSSSVAALIHQRFYELYCSMSPGCSGFMDYLVSKGTIDMLVRTAAGAYASKNIKVYSLNIGAFSSEMTDRFEEITGGTVAGFNPYFKTKMGNPSHISKVISSLLDGSSKYKSGDHIIIDNDSTINAKHYYDLFFNPGPDTSLGWLAPEDAEKVMKDLKGDKPYDFSKIKADKEL